MMLFGSHVCRGGGGGGFFYFGKRPSIVGLVHNDGLFQGPSSLRATG